MEKERMKNIFISKIFGNLFEFKKFMQLLDSFVFSSRHIYDPSDPRKSYQEAAEKWPIFSIYWKNETTIVINSVSGVKSDNDSEDSENRGKNLEKIRQTSKIQ